MTKALTANQAVLLVARREFRTQVRSRSFVIGLVLTLALLVGGALFGAFISGVGSTNSLGLTPDTAALRPALEQVARDQDATLEIRELDDGTGRAQVDGDDLDALLTGSAGGYELLGRDAVDDGVTAIVTTAVRQQALTTALAGAGLNPADLDARSQISVDTLQPQDPNRAEQVGLALIGTVLLFFSLSGYGQVVATGVVEEKQSRVVELLLSTIRPWQLLAGKVLGLGAVGLLQLVILAGIGLVAAAAFGVLGLPLFALGTLGMVVLWYVLGFFLFASIYAAVGSTVSRQEELNSLVAPMIFLLIIPFVVVVNLLPNDPRNPVAAVLSYVPLFSQTVMPARYALGAAALWEVAVSALIAIVAIVVVVRVAGRVYENSVLRTGARVPLREAFGASPRK